MSQILALAVGNALAIIIQSQKFYWLCWSTKENHMVNQCRVQSYPTHLNIFSIGMLFVHITTLQHWASSSASIRAHGCRPLSPATPLSPIDRFMHCMNLSMAAAANPYSGAFPLFRRRAPKLQRQGVFLKHLLRAIGSNRCQKRWPASTMLDAHRSLSCVRKVDEYSLS